MTTHDQILALKPKSILDHVPAEIFIERDSRDHPYIRSGNYYEVKWAVAKFLQPRAVLEIGVRFGYSLATFIMASDKIERAEGWDNCSYHPKSNEMAQENLAKHLPKKIPINLRTLECHEVQSITGQFDFIHIDGPHYLPWTFHCLELCKAAKVPAILIDDYVNCPSDADAAKRFVQENTSLIRETVQLDSDRGEFLILLHK